ncbi:hypothetical protein TIFTF001_016408 [Ficus carica]|uniref:Uncharacterized protein n=1 Tax=Ficus carica TaxID=3494 RepID=A0AA88AJI8_FICCA|nr:hypothetical protein TIFTF001_016408 [Ficus carica]
MLLHGLDLITYRVGDGVPSRGCGSNMSDGNVKVNIVGIQTPIEVIWMERIEPKLYGVKAVVGWKPLGKKFVAAKPGCMEFPKVVAMAGSRVLKMDAHAPLVKSFGALFVSVMATVVAVLSRSAISAIGLTVVPNYRGPVMMPFYLQMMIVSLFGVEHAIFGEGKLSLLNLAMNKDGFMIFPCYNFGSDIDRLVVDVRRLGSRASLLADEVFQVISGLILDLRAI